MGSGFSVRDRSVPCGVVGDLTHAFPRWQFYYTSELRGLRFFTQLLFRHTPDHLMVDQTLQVAQEAAHVYLFGQLLEDHGEKPVQGDLGLQEHLALRVAKPPLTMIGRLAMAATVEQLALAEYNQRLKRKTYACDCEKEALEMIVEDESWHVDHLQNMAHSIDEQGVEWAKWRIQLRMAADRLREDAGPLGAGGELFRAPLPHGKVH